MLYKILHNVNHPLHLKLPQFAKINSFYSAYSSKNDISHVLAMYNTYQFSRCFTYSSTRLGNSLPNEAVLAVLAS